MSGLRRLDSIAISVVLLTGGLIISDARAEDPGPVITYSGVVTSGGVPIPGARVTQTPKWWSATTDSSGRYSVTKYADDPNIEGNHPNIEGDSTFSDGSFTLTVRPPGCWHGASKSAIRVENNVIDFELTKREFGVGEYSCNRTDYSWKQAETPVPIVDYPTDCAWGVDSSANDYADTALPFPIRYYGTEYSSARIGRTGWIDFAMDGYPKCSFSGEFGPYYDYDHVPDTRTPNATIWAGGRNKCEATGCTKLEVHSSVVGSAPNRIYVVKWSGSAAYPGGVPSDILEAQISEDGRISLHYAVGGSGLVGIENADGTKATQYRCIRCNPSPIWNPGDPEVPEGVSILPETAVEFVFNDGTPPVLASTDPSNGGITRGTQITARFDERLAPSSSISVTRMGGAVAGTSSLSSDLKGLLFAPTSQLTEGAYNATAVAVDEAGNSSTFSWSFTVDTTGPTLTIIRPSSGASVRRSVRIEVSVSDPSGVGGGTYSFAGMTRPLGYEASTGLYVDTLDTANIANGDYTLSVTAVDALGNSTRTEIPISVDNAHHFYAAKLYQLISGLSLSGGSSSLAHRFDGDEAKAASYPMIESPGAHRILWTAEVQTNETSSVPLFDYHVYFQRGYEKSIDNIHEFVFLFNYKTGSWVLVSDRWFLNVDSVFSDLDPTGDPSDYVASDGTVRIMVDARSGWPFRSNADMVNFRLTL